MKRHIKVTCSGCGAVVRLDDWSDHAGFDCSTLRPQSPLSASDVLEARLDREPWSGKLHAETRLALAEQIIRSLATEHVIPSTAKALCESYFAVTR